MNKIFVIFTVLILFTSCGRMSESKVSKISKVESSSFDFSQLSNEKKCWGQGHNLNKKNQPISCVDCNNLYGKYGGIFMCNKEKTMYLTFDEGYENGYTAQILDTLKEKKTSALFFVTSDYVKRNDVLIKRMIDEGHIIGNHSWSHPSMPDISDEECISEITKLHKYMLEKHNYEMKYIRPPRGEFSERTLAIAQNLGYKTILWSFAYKDFDVNNQPDPTAAFNRITGASHDGAIYLLHAVSKTNADILGDVIDCWKKDGYKIAKFDI